MLALAVLAGAAALRAGGLALAMLLVQFGIGAANDYVDAPRDALTKPSKPIVNGLVRRRDAATLAAVCGGGGVAVAALVAPVVAPVAALILAIGVAYDIALKPRGMGWLAFAVAFPLLPVFAWYGAVMALPPRAELLLPVAALAGPTLQLANGIVDLERDRRLGLGGLAVGLGRRRGVAVLGALQVTIQVVAWLSLLRDPAGPATIFSLAALGASTGLAAMGVLLSGAAAVGRREWGWRLQACAIGLLAVGWLASVRSG